MVEELIPIVMFISLALVFIALFWFRYRSRADMQQTIRQALDKGIELSPDLIDRLGAPKPAANKDLRLGVIWMSLAVGLVLIAIINPDPIAVAWFQPWNPEGPSQQQHLLFPERGRDFAAAAMGAIAARTASVELVPHPPEGSVARLPTRRGGIELRSIRADGLLTTGPEGLPLRAGGRAS